MEKNSELKKKVVWIVNEYNIPGELRTRQTVLSQRLKEHGYDVYLISGSVHHRFRNNIIKDGSAIKKEEYDGATYYVVNTSVYHNSIERVLVAIQFQRRLWYNRHMIPKPDVIVSDFAGLFGNVFLKWKKRYGTRIIYDILDLWPEGFVDMGYIRSTSFIAKYLYALEHKSYRNADGIIFSMRGGRDYIIDKGWSREVGGDVDTSNIGYLNNGVDLESVDQQRLDYVLEDADLESDDFKVVYLGSISEFNGVDTIVDTAKTMQEAGKDKVRFLIYGCGNQEKKLRIKVEELGLQNIKFKGKLEKEYAMSVLSRADLNVFTFKDTPLLKYGVSPNKLFMYFASGKPVLSMIRPAYDLVEEKKAGISVDNKVEVISGAIERFMRMSESEYQEYCINARKTAEEYDYKNLVDVLIDKIEGVE